LSQSPHAVGHDTYQYIVEMVRVNLFHALPPRLNPDGAEYDPEEDEPILEAAWPHLMIVYELFLCFLDMPNFSATVAANMINGAFVRQLVALFDSEDPRERDYLKTTLHRIYGKIMTLRTLIRSEIISLFINSVEMHHPHNGIGELLEIMGSIINGFAVPIKPEHTVMLYRALLPLHKSSHYALFRRQLVYCVAQFIEKDQTLAPRVFQYLTLHWPRGRQSHVQYRIEELATLLPLLDDLHFRQVSPLVFPRLAECIEGDHYAVVDKALGLLRIDVVVELVYRYRHIVMPIVLPCLFRASKHLGHDVLRKRAHDLLRSYMSFDRALFATCTERYRAESKAKPRLAKQRDELWRILEERAVLQERGVPEELLIQIAPLAASPRMSDALSSPPPPVRAATTVAATATTSASEVSVAVSSSSTSAPAPAAVSSSSAVVAADSLKTNSSSPTESDSLPSPRRHKSHKSEKKKLKAKKKKRVKEESLNKHKSSSSSASPPPPNRTPPTSSN
jgi:serine/threonine-protein phosphatase 2A regulatory subunit B'